MFFHKKSLLLLFAVNMFFLLRILYFGNGRPSGHTIENLHGLTTGYAGANAMIVQGSLYVAIYLIFLTATLPELRAQLIVRSDRPKVARGYALNIASCSLLFALVFTTMDTFFLVFLFGFEFLEYALYFLGWGLQFLALSLMYLFVGMIYLTIYFQTRSKASSMLYTVILSTILCSTSVIYHFWSPYKTLDVFDRMYGNGLSLLGYSIELLLAATLCYGLYLIGIALFKRRDIL